MKQIKHLFVVALLLVTVGCSARYTNNVYNVDHTAVVTHSKQVSQEEVGKVIARSGTALGWTMQDVRPGFTIATLHLRTHVAVVNIHYTANSYSIKYASSVNLTKNGKIHKNYNGWIHNLDNAIKRNLAMTN